MIYQSLQLQQELHVEQVAQFLIESEIADADHCYNPSVLILRVEDFGMSFVLIAMGFQMFCCMAVFVEMQRSK